MGSQKHNFDSLQKSLSPKAAVLTADSEGYEDALKRWSESNVKKAVSLGVFL
jgi:hypothetical protein